MRSPGRVSGHETDKISPRSPENVQLLAKGLNPDEGGAGMVYYEDGQPRRAVFSRLDHFGRRRCLVDEEVLKITANVLRSFLDWTQTASAS